MRPLRLLHLDDELVAIDKPAGLLVHPSGLDAHETVTAWQLLSEQLGQPVWPLHRLDKATSGVLLFARSAGAARLWRAAFEAGTVAKRYLALVRGHPAELGEIDHPLLRIRDDYEWRGDRMETEAQPALTHYRRLAEVELDAAVDKYPTSRYALVALEPKTGRRHQLRHAAERVRP